MKFDVITFGSAVVDVFVNTDISERGRFISYPVGSKILIRDLRFDIGGGGTNTAVAFSRLGLKTGCICALGDDNNSKKILDLLKNEGIKFLGLIKKQGTCGYSIILDSKEKDRTILTYKGINDDIGFNKIRFSKIKTKWLYYSSLLDKSFMTQKRLAEILVKNGARLAFNPSSYLIKKENLKPILKLCEVLILNREEAEMLCKDKDLLLGLHKLGPRIIVITNKNKLISCYDGRKKYFLKPNKIKVIERTGAGDAFASGFTSGLIAGRSINESLNLGLKESESVIGHFGAKNNLIKMKLKSK